MLAKYRMFGFLVHDVARLLRKRFELHAKDIGLTRSQWQTLVYLSRNEGTSQSRLAELSDVEPVTLGKIVDRLVDIGLIERAVDPSDRRVWRLHLAPDARPKLKQARKLGDLTRREALAGVSEEDRSQLMETLLTLRSNLSVTRERPMAKKTAANGQSTSPKPGNDVHRYK
ncbi:MarR family winged helix-turn-helix transcriptional regulator [Bradyrhizobium sp. AZCC 2289]|uniref:MarR family winged helix-turn-helix transcriptional regulator n=1 Tax=Bradyrhizobium sp. AZCC 2289 TaxID=3117026 RepID=UPI002FF3B05F